MSLRIAVIGVGHLGRHHARILASLPGADLVAVVDTNRRRAEEIAAAQRTRELEPTSLITNSHLGWIYYLARQYDQSIAQAE